MNENIFIGKKTKEGFKIYKRAEMQQILNALEEGVQVEVILRPKKKKRSMAQNSLFHVYIDIIAKEIGKSKDWVKQEMKRRFLTVDAKDDLGNLIINKVTGEVLTEVRHTASLGVGEMMELCEEIRMFVLDFGIYLEKPDEQGALKFTGL